MGGLIHAGVHFERSFDVFLYGRGTPKGWVEGHQRDGVERWRKAGEGKKGERGGEQRDTTRIQ